MNRRTEVREAPTAVESEYRVAEARTVDTVDAAVPPWSPLQVLGILVGIGFGVVGIAAVARTGFDTAHIYTPHDVVWKLPHSPLLGVIEIGFGLLWILGSIVPGGGARAFLTLLSAISLAFGIVVLTESIPNRLNDWLAVTHRNGWVYAITGGVMLVASLLAPVFGGVRRRQHVVSHDQTVS